MADKKILRLLIVDDSPDDAELATAALRKSSYMLKTQRVQDLAGLTAALDKSTWDIVLSEMTLAHFGASMAIDALKRANRDLPLIVFTRTIREDDLIKVMRAGALDVVRKDEAFRLGPVLERELRVADERREWHSTAQKLSELDNKHRAVVESARDAIGYCQDGMHVDANPAYLDLYGYSKNELEGLPVMNLVEKSDQARFKEFLRKAGKEAAEFVAVKKDGTRTHVELLISSVTFNGEACLQVTAVDISKRKAAESRLQYLNRHDPLTGLYNRQHFLQALEVALEEARKGHSTGGLVYLDLNQIKSINEQFGHAAGDRMLLKIARLFRDQLGDEAILARFGGDEFTVLLKNVDEAALRSTAEVLCTAVKRAEFSEGGKTFRFECNAGTSLVTKQAPNVQKLLSDTYHAAQPTRSHTTLAPPIPTVAADIPAMTTPMSPALPVDAVKPPVQSQPPAQPKIEKRRVVVSDAPNSWSARLVTALDKNAFELVYQPIVNLHGEPAEYFEVLVRLIGEDGQPIAAGEFMPAAEAAGLGAAIDRWVTHSAIEALQELHRQDRHATFFVNLCPASFREPDLVIQTQKQLFAAGLKPKYVSFEADESAILAAPAEARTFIQAVKKIGCRFAVDNFGDSMSNLNQLKDMPVDCFKIAGAQIQNIADDGVAQSTLKALVQVIKALDKQVVAKSVERAEDLAVLWKLEIDYVQGHYFQEAESHLSYEFSAEESVSVAPASPNWASATGKH